MNKERERETNWRGKGVVVEKGMEFTNVCWFV